MLSVQAADIRARLVSSIITENACFVVTDGHARGLASLSCGACEGSEGEGSACLRPASVLVCEHLMTLLAVCLISHFPCD